MGMSFNLHHIKQAQEVIFSRKTNIRTKPSLYFNNATVEQIPVQKHFIIYLDSMLLFPEHINDKIRNTLKSIGLLHKLLFILLCQCFLTIYKSFMRPHLDYGDVTYDQPSNDSFPQKIESAKHRAALAITGTIKVTSCETCIKIQDLNIFSKEDG